VRRPAGTRLFRPRSTRRSKPPRRASSAQRDASRLLVRPFAGSATALGPATAASSRPSSRPTCRGTTPQCPATSVRASASTPSTSSSRRASAFRPSRTWTCTRGSSAPRSPRRAVLRLRRTCVGKPVRKPRVRPRSACCPLPRSALVVLVVAAKPAAAAKVTESSPHGLVAPAWRAVEPLVHAPEAVQTARVR
jgi:hypothetical protein